MRIERGTSKPRGFTLVELLVVIAIIITLAGLTIIVVRKGAIKADAAKVTTNMKSIYRSLTVLKTEGVNTGHHAPSTFPPYEGSLQDGRRSDFIWWDLVAESMSIARRDEADFRWLTPYSETMLQNPLSDKKLGVGMEEPVSLIGNPELSFGGFAYNAELGDSVDDDDRMDRVRVIRDTDLQDAASTIFFAESADTRMENDETPGWIFTKWENAPQGNYKDSAHCCMISGNVMLIKNKDLKDPKIFAFYTSIKDKNYDDQP